jgi:hypothetical protein
MAFGFNVFFRTLAQQESSEALSGCCFQNSSTSRNGEVLSGGCLKKLYTTTPCVI